METAAGKRGRPKKKKGRPTTRDTVVDQKLPKHQKKKVYHHQYYEDCKEENAGDTEVSARGVYPHLHHHHQKHQQQHHHQHQYQHQHQHEY